MKRPIVTAVFLLAVAGIAGCPIYDNGDGGCFVNADCAPQFACDRGTGTCYLPGDLNCSRPSDCDVNATCGVNAQCVPGDCSFNGCVSGYRCDSSQGIWQCVLNGSGEAGASGEAGGPAQGGAPGGTTTGGQGGGASGAADSSAAGVAGGG